jgi:hypothetical protein
VAIILNIFVVNVVESIHIIYQISCRNSS